MSDLPPSDTPPADPPAGVVADPTPPVPSGDLGVSASPPVGDPEPTPSEGDSFDRPYVEKLRNEAAENRVKANELQDQIGRYSAVFDGVPDDTVDAFLELSKTLISDPDHAGPMELIRTARALLGDRFDEALVESKAPKYLTAEEARKQFDQQMKEQQNEASRKAAVEAIQKEARDLGYEDGTPENNLLFYFAVNKTNSDLAKAHEEVGAYRQAIIDQFVEEQGNINGSYPPVSNTGGSPSDRADAPKTLDQANRAAAARLSAALN